MKNAVLIRKHFSLVTESTMKKALLKSSFFCIGLLSGVAWRITPSLPQRGKQPKGSIPLTPSFLGVYSNLIWSYRNGGDARAAGAEA